MAPVREIDWRHNGRTFLTDAVLTINDRYVHLILGPLSVMWTRLHLVRGEKDEGML